MKATALPKKNHSDSLTPKSSPLQPHPAQPAPSNQRSIKQLSQANAALPSVQAVMQLQKALGNSALVHLLTSSAQLKKPQTGQVVQRQHILEEDRASSMEKLKSKYPNIKDASSAMGEKAEQFWGKHMLEGKNPMLMEHVIDNILSNYLLEDEFDYPITITFVYAGDEMNLNVLVKKPMESESESSKQKEDKLLSLTQVFMPGEPLNVKIQTVTATERGGKPLFKNSLIPLYEKMGVRHLTLDASGIGGRQDGVYAWVRYGFVPDQENWMSMQGLGLRLIEEDKTKRKLEAKKKKPKEELIALDVEEDNNYHLPLELVSIVTEILKQQDAAAIRRLVHLSWEHKDKRVSKFLNIILTASGSWNGSLDLANETDRAWLLNYVNCLSADQYEQLLPALKQESKQKNEKCLVQ